MGWVAEKLWWERFWTGVSFEIVEFNAGGVVANRNPWLVFAIRMEELRRRLDSD